MQFSSKFFQFDKWVTFILTIILIHPSSSANHSQFQLICGSPNNALNSTLPMSFVPNFVNVMESLQTQVSATKSGHASITSPAPEVFALAQCQHDLSSFDCNHCFGQGRVKLPRCIPNSGARVFLDGCFLRYDTYNFFHEVENPKFDSVDCSRQTNLSIEQHQQMEFAQNVAILIGNVSDFALKNGTFATIESVILKIPVYGLAQCWDLLEFEECKECLMTAGKQLGDCGFITEGKALFTGCYLRFSTKKFFNSSCPIVVSEYNGPDTYFITSIASAAFRFLVLACLGAYMGYKRLSEIRKEEQEKAKMRRALSSNLNYKYEVLEKATNYFSDEMKLGEGGAGTVFKGTLQDGKTVAAKRLVYKTGQWVDQFFNEVNLISGIQHKNLVRLLGCSIEGPQSLLIYEYVPNKSLDQMIFGEKQKMVLSWEERYEIIGGLAEGLAYLHGGGGMKIIHRDIKASNVLLDEDFTPKISDFGLARFANDECCVSGIAGTLGYMAPEYLVRGQLTEKADVYGFGVLVLEIACGRKNSVYTQGSSSILHTVWKQYKAKAMEKAVDPRLKGECNRKEVENMLQIGLICTQTSSSLRPLMSEIVEMLRCSDGVVIPTPKQPPFLNASVLSAGSSTENSITKVTLSTRVLLGHDGMNLSIS